MTRACHCPLLLLTAIAACDVQAPWFVETLIAADTIDPHGSYSVTSIVIDDVGVTEVVLSYQMGQEAAPIEVEMSAAERDDLWIGQIPGPHRSTTIYYWLTASDAAGNHSSDPALAPDTYTFKVTDAPALPPTPDAGSPDVGRPDAGSPDNAQSTPDAMSADLGDTTDLG